MYRIGLFLTIIWIVLSLYLYVTAIEMEILAALLVFLIGGYLLGIYFLVVWTIKQSSHKRKGLGIILSVIWISIPILADVLNL